MTPTEKRLLLFSILLLTPFIILNCTRRGGTYGPAIDVDRYSRAAPAAPMAYTPPPTPKGMAAQGAQPRDDRDPVRGADQENLGDALRDAPTDPWSGERYAAPRDNPFVAVNTPGGDASTFSLDVDTASYSLVRRYLTNGRLPPAGAVRIEELINTIPYTYPAPTANDEQPLRITPAVAVCPWAQQHRLVRIAVHGRELNQRSRPPLNLVFLVDTSGSMSGANRLPLVIRSLEKLSAVLDERDRLAIVTYAGSSSVPLPAIAGDQHERITAALRDLTASGSTNGAGGIISAYAEAAKNLAPGVQSRVVLCTDGDFNVGTTSQNDLRRLIEQQRSTGIYLTIFGFGMGNNKDETLEMLADRGNGSYGYINDEADANRLVVGGAIGQLVTIAKDAKVQVFFNPAFVAGWRQIGYENRQLRREDFANDQIDAGEIGAGHTVTALYEVVPVGVPVPALAGEANPFIPASRSDAPAAAQPGLLQQGLLEVRLRWKAPEQEVSRLHEQTLDGTVSAMDADFSTAAGIAAFGMMLRQSPYKGSADWSMAETLVRNGITRDPQRQEALSLITAAHGLAR